MNSEKIVLFSPNKIYVSPARNKEQSASAPHSVWRIFYLPDDYISVNWPLRVSKYCENLIFKNVLLFFKIV